MKYNIIGHSSFGWNRNKKNKKYSIYIFITFAEETFVHDTSGRSHYTKICNQLGLVPINYFMRHIQDTELAMRYHGLGPSAARAIALVLKVGFFIQMYSTLQYCGNFIPTKSYQVQSGLN